MKRCQLKWLIMSVAICLVFGLSSPGSAGQGGNGNGFPEGDHYNLNLIAKKSVQGEPGFFTCPDPALYQWDYYNNVLEVPCTLDANGNPDATNCVKCTPDFALYSDDLGGCAVRFPSAQNVIFVPRSAGETVSIQVQSGAARPGKKSTIAPSLKVTDWCTQTFDNDPAVFQLPENSGGYRVYARVTGKPLEGTAWTFTTPVIQSVQDEYGNELYWFGTIGGADGCTDSDGNVLLERTDSTRKGKGVKQATDLSCLFNFAGDVCYVNDLCYYCEGVDENNEPIYTCAPPDPALIDPAFLCCANQGDPTILDSCGEPANFNCVAPTEQCVAYDPEAPTTCIEWAWVCPETQPFSIPLQCHSYADDTWVFNIADFVNVLWNSQSEGGYVIQLRFYKN